jgi:hypothetical protein
MNLHEKIHAEGSRSDGCGWVIRPFYNGGESPGCDCRERSDRPSLADEGQAGNTVVTLPVSSATKQRGMRSLILGRHINRKGRKNALSEDMLRLSAPTLSHLRQVAKIRPPQAIRAR